MSDLRFFEGCHYDKKELENVKKLLRPNGTSMILPYDQFVEHDNRHVSPNPKAGHPDYVMDMAVKGGFNGVAVHYGVAKRYWQKLKSPRVPLVLKINGKTSIPSADHPLSVHTSFIDDAVRIGATAIGYTLYYGSSQQDRDIPQLARVRQDCEKAGLPLIVWAYPRGAAMNEKGGAGTSYALESAARMAMEMGATIIKSNMPSAAKDGFDDLDVPDYFKDLEKELQALPEQEQKLERTRRVVESAQGIPVLFSGGKEKSDEQVVENAEICQEAGCFGFIYGRNMWKREIDDGVEMAGKLAGILDKA